VPFVNDMVDSFAKEQREMDESGPKAADTVLTPSKVVTRFTYDVEKVMKLLRSRIVGQSEVLQTIEEMLRLVRVDIADPQRPLFVCLFLGPTGVGKTELVRLLAEAIHGNRESFCRVDMNTLSQEHYAASLTGAPPGYVGSKEGQTILDKEKIEGSFRAPGIVLFDEVEKASSPVLQALLNVFDNGIMTVASGQLQINFRNSLIFMTSNIAAREIQEYAQRKSQSWWNRWFGIGGVPSESKTQEMIRKGLEEKFSPEFLNRLDEIVTFNWIRGDVLRDIISLEIERLNHRIAKHQCKLSLDVSLINHLAKVGFDKRYGARSLKRAVRKYVEVPLANYLFTRPWNPNAPLQKITAVWSNAETLFYESP
jgi:ATP-dependent Clp protease ATP-binding subunit ClpA